MRFQSLVAIVMTGLFAAAPVQAQSLWERLQQRLAPRQGQPGQNAQPDQNARQKPVPATECVFDHCDPPGGAAPPASTGAPQVAPAPPLPAGLPSEAPGNFDFYVLSLSWSSGFCDTNDNGRAKSQCDIGANLGFVVHGLWPQFERGFPSDCAAGRAVSQQALASTRGLFPDTGLARYEWNKHGTCSGRSPDAYFADVRRARDAIVIPPEFQNPRTEQSFAPNEIVRAFTAANPRLRPGMLAVGCKSGVLQELRFCFSKDLRSFRACEEVTRQSCHVRDIRVPPVR